MNDEISRAATPVLEYRGSRWRECRDDHRRPSLLEMALKKWFARVYLTLIALGIIILWIAVAHVASMINPAILLTLLATVIGLVAGIAILARREQRKWLAANGGLCSRFGHALRTSSSEQRPQRDAPIEHEDYETASQ